MLDAPEALMHGWMDGCARGTIVVLLPRSRLRTLGGLMCALTREPRPRLPEIL